MTRRFSIRWKLILSTWALAVAIAVGLVVVLHARTETQLLHQLDRTLETKCDEVLSVLAGGGTQLTLAALFAIETNYRFSPYTYFYQVADGAGRPLARSDNLGDARLPYPAALVSGGVHGQVLIEEAPYPDRRVREESVRIRSERVSGVRSPWATGPLVVQVAVSQAPLRAAMRHSVRQALLYAAGGLGLVFVLLWSVTTRAFRPVAHMTTRASTITAANLRERLPVSGSGDELDRLAHVLNGMLNRLQGSLQQMEEFTSGAAHQLRTPLTRIRGELDMVLRNGVSPEVRGQLERVQEELERLTRMCGRLLLLARLDHEARDQHLFSERVDLEAVVGELVEQMTPLASDKGVRLGCRATASAYVRGSRQLIVEALLNLLHNALRCVGTGGQIEVAIGGGNDHMTVSVEDSGPGIPEDEQARIFRPFYSSARGTGDAEGTGLGLAIVRAIARAHGGDVTLASAPGRGSCFRLTLPLGETPRRPTGKSRVPA